MDYKETIKERIKILPDELRDFVLDENWRRDAEKIGKEFSLSEEVYASLENEIFLVLLCFEPRNDFVENIKNELGMDSDTAGQVTEDVKKEIFSKIANELDEMEKQMGEEKETEKTGKQGGVGSSFEQIILNQARAMQPARPADEAGNSERPVVSGQTEDNQKQQATNVNVPENLPTEQEKTGVIHNYVPGSDPYREPIG